MRYLNKREDFLREKNSNSINKIKSINEEADTSGPFANDVGWNDSLLGRLINHIIRKARIARKVGQIKKLIERLQDEFNYLLDQSVQFSLGDESQLLLIKITLSSFFKELIFAVENGRPVSELIGLTDGAINAVNNAKELDKKDVLLEELKKFREFLNQFKDEEGSGGDDSEENSESGSTDTEGIVANSYGLMVKNLKALALILTNYKKVNTGESTGATGKPKVTYITKNGDKLNLIQSDNTKNPKKLDIATIRSKNPKLSTYAKDDQSLPSGMVLIMEAADSFGTGGSANRGKTVVGEDHLTQAFNKLKKDIEVLISPREKGIAVDYTLINDIVTNSNNTDSKKLIKNLYNEVNRYLVGDKKATIQEKDTLYNEGIEILNDKNKIVVIAEKIARFSKRALQFEKEGLYGGLGDLKVPLQTFVTTLLQINKVPIVTAKKESLFSYSSFLEAKNILPSGKPDNNTGAIAAPQGGTASGDVQGQSQSQGEGGDQSKKILEFFNQTCVEVRAFTATDEEIAKLKEELAAKEKEGGSVIMSMDPIIEIMKLFIKAYKLYTVQTITKRSEKVDTNTLSEYTSFGGNSSGDGDSGRNGPYRNNKLFDAWEEGVNDIRKNRKYQVFFTKNAKLRLPTVPNPNPAKADDWEIKDDAGIKFNKFINDLLDGEKLYKSGTERGKVAVFVDSYFGEGSTTGNNQEVMSTLDQNDLDDAGKLENSKQKLYLELGKANPPVKGIDLKANTIFTITYKDDEDKTKQRTFLIHEIDGDKVYMSYSFINYYRNKYLNRMNGPQKNIVKGSSFPMELATNSTQPVKYKYTMVKKNEFDNIFKAGNTITVSSVDNDGVVTSPVFKGISDVYWLVYTKDKKIYTIDNTTEPKLDKVILQAGNKPCKITVNSKSNIQIKKS